MPQENRAELSFEGIHWAHYYEQNIVIDLEFTPTTSEGHLAGLFEEIIQIGAVRVDSKGNLLDSFQKYVQPLYAKRVSRTVNKLTHITNEDLQQACFFTDVWKEFIDWVGQGKTRFISWSLSDYVQLAKELALANMDIKDFASRWMDLQKVYPRVTKLPARKHTALKTASFYLGIEGDGKYGSFHQALYDAVVTAEIFRDLVTGKYKKASDSILQVLKKPNEMQPLTYNIASKYKDALASLSCMQL